MKKRIFSLLLLCAVLFSFQDAHAHSQVVRLRYDVSKSGFLLLDQYSDKCVVGHNANTSFNYFIDEDAFQDLAADYLIPAFYGGIQTWTGTGAGLTFTQSAGSQYVITCNYEIANVYAYWTTQNDLKTQHFSSLQPDDYTHYHHYAGKISFNTYKIPEGAQTSYVTAIAAHEIGHWIGFDDQYDPNHTNALMYGYFTLGDSHVSSPTAAELQGMKVILGLHTDSNHSYAYRNAGSVNEHYCTVCGGYATEPHQYTDLCDQSCNVCFYVDTSRVHNLSSWINNGEYGEIRNCTRSTCSYVETRAHTTSGSWALQPTCTAGGSWVIRCSTCPYQKSESKPALGHDYRYGNCNYEYCARSGCTYSSGSTSHSISYGNCTYEYCTKSGCGYSSGSSSHSMTSGTCNYQYCSRGCGYSTGSTTHNLVSGTCTYKYCSKSGCSYSTGSSTHTLSSVSGCSYRYCTKGCGYSTGSSAHSWGGWVTISSPSCTSTGTRQAL